MGWVCREQLRLCCPGRFLWEVTLKLNFEWQKAARLRWPSGRTFQVEEIANEKALEDGEKVSLRISLAGTDLWRGECCETMGRDQMMKRILKKTNQEFMFDSRCGRMPLEGFFFFSPFKKVFIRLCWVLVAAHGICCIMQDLSWWHMDSLAVANGLQSVWAQQLLCTGLVALWHIGS